MFCANFKRMTVLPLRIHQTNPLTFPLDTVPTATTNPHCMLQPAENTPVVLNQPDDQNVLTMRTSTMGKCLVNVFTLKYRERNYSHH